MVARAKILLVDDDELLLEILHAKLAERYDVVSTNTPGHVVRLARDTEPDLIVCDFDMPDMDGGDVSEALRADPELRLVPLLFLTSLATTNDMKRIRKQIGGRPAISKDSPIEAITARIDELLKQD